MTGYSTLRCLASRGPAWICLLLILAAGRVAPAQTTGQEIYRQQCASCHGADGKGVAGQYERALAGDRSAAELEEFIVEAMPEEDPDACVGAEAAKVAAYVYRQFYSPMAQSLSEQPRVALSRLTVRQYQNSVADVVGSFGQPVRHDEQRGWSAEYFGDSRLRRPVVERRDPVIDFDYQEGSPESEKMDAEGFAVRWRGTVLPRDTGKYEFVVRTENGIRLWVNDLRRPLIDGWVRSGTTVEHRESVRLIGGRAYPVRLEFFKSKKGKEKTASVTLLWKPPLQAETVIPQRRVSPHRSPPSLALRTAFPPDDRSIGYERGTAVSKRWQQATTYAAIEVADYVAQNLRELSGVDKRSADRAPRLREFCRKFAARAFRRPLTDEQQAFFVDRHFDDAADLELAVKRSILLVLKSPRFLYREIGAPADEKVDSYDVAARLSYVLWDAPPDQNLAQAAAAARLVSPEQVRTQAARMVADPQTATKLRQFLHQWLKVDQIVDLSKDHDLFPDFDEQTASDLRISLDLFLDEVMASDPADYRRLFLDEHLYLNGRLAAWYAADLPLEADFQKVAFDPQRRAGVLSHPFLMTGFSYQAASSPIHRGVFVARSLLGRSLRPPPEAVAPLSPKLHAGLTTRQRVVLQTKPSACQSCHSTINGLGFAMEHYDAAGRFRDQEVGKAIDASGQYRTLTGQRIEFNGVRELAGYLVDSEEARDAFVEQVFQYFVKQPIRAYGPETLDNLTQSFVEHDFDMRQLLVDVAAVSSLQSRNSK